jgi:putative transposase
MARQRRLVLPGLAHLLSLPALSGVQPFPTAADRARFLELLREGTASESVQVHAYALLPAEVRLLATPSHEQGLSRLVQALGRRYVSAYNREHKRAGTLWSGRFRCAPVEPGPWALWALRHVDAGSSEPGLTSAAQRCGAPRQWPLVDPAEYWQLGNTPFERESAYASLLAEPLPEAQASRLQRCLIGGWMFGNPALAARLGVSTARPLSPRPRGRPARPG